MLPLRKAIGECRQAIIKITCQWYKAACPLAHIIFLFYQNKRKKKETLNALSRVAPPSVGYHPRL